MAVALHPLDEVPTASGTASRDTRSSDLCRRFGVALIGLPFVVAMIALGPLSSGALFGVAAGLGCAEYCRLTLGSIPVVAWLGIGASAMMPPAVVLLSPEHSPCAVFGILAVASNLSWTILLAAGPRPTAPQRIGHVMAGVLFSSVGLVMLSALRAAADGMAWTAVVLAGTWANDVAAYLGGRTFGRHKLWPSVSPGKTWEGFVAGFVGGIAGLLAIRPWLPQYFSVHVCVLLGALTGLVAPVGDLCKSMLKRAYHVKDTGRLFPGHGGMLDRIDGVLFVSPVIAFVRMTFFPR